MKKILTLCLLAPSLIFAQEIKVPAGFHVSEIGKDLGSTRHLAVSKQGDVYAKLSKLKDGKGILLLKDKDKDGVYEEQTLFGNYTGTGIAIHDDYFYASSNKGVFRDADFFNWLEVNMAKLMQLDEKVLSEAIYRSCQNKADVVAKDEHEQGERALLNLGHTFGHAIENAMGYGVWLHGEAVATGTMMAADLSQRMAWLSANEVARIKNSLIAANLPINPPKLGTTKYLDLMGLDKKVENGKIRLVLQQGIGKAVITSDYDAEKLAATLSLCWTSPPMPLTQHFH